MSRERELLRECHRILADYVVDDESNVIAPLLERVSNILSQPEAEPITCPLCGSPDKGTKLFVGSGALSYECADWWHDTPSQHEASVAAVERHKGATPETAEAARKASAFDYPRIMRDKAEELERQRDELRAENERLHETILNIRGKLNKGE